MHPCGWYIRLGGTSKGKGGSSSSVLLHWLLPGSSSLRRIRFPPSSHLMANCCCPPRPPGPLHVPVLDLTREAADAEQRILRNPSENDLRTTIWTKFLLGSWYACTFSFFFPNTRAAYHCIKTKKKLVQYSVTTQMKRTPDGHKPASWLNTTRKKNSNMNYSHSAQSKGTMDCQFSS